MLTVKSNTSKNYDESCINNNKNDLFRRDTLKNAHKSLAMKWIIAALVAFQLIITSHGERSQNRRLDARFEVNHELIQVFDTNRSNPFVSAREYLGKFGWVDPPVWSAVSPRLNETIGEGSLWSGSFEPIQVEVDFTPNDNSDSDNEYLAKAVKNRFDALSEEDFESALRNFQGANGLLPTGVLDEETLLMMTQLRCGVPDQTAEQNFTVLTTTPPPSTNLTNANSSEEEDVSSSGDGASPQPMTSPPSSLPTPTFSPKLVRKRSLLKSEYGKEPQVGEYHWPPVKSEAFFELYESFGGETLQGAIDMNEKYISEAESPDESRVAGMENILEALRKEKIGKSDVESYFDVMEESSAPSPGGLVARITLHSREEQRRRVKRSNLFNLYRGGNGGWGLAFAKKTITWRLVKEWPSINNPFMSANEVWFTVKLAFRMWSEILPRNFREDTTSPVSDVDILIGFGTGLHNRCPVKFFNGPFRQEYAHAWPLPKAEIHFNDAQPFVPVSWVPDSHVGGIPNTRRSSSYPISLLKVAIHEIGHTIGLPHSKDRLSVMNPYYQPFQSKDVVELSNTDREATKKIYGSCDMPFDLVFDWVRQVYTKDGRTVWKYNTYFFRNGWYWWYLNRKQRPRYGDPLVTVDNWRGILDRRFNQKLDGVVHIRDWKTPFGPTFFFRGDVYIEYDNNNDRAKLQNDRGQRYPRRIADDFPGIPYPIDTVFYKMNEGVLYFFKNRYVYLFNWENGNVTAVYRIQDMFPGWGNASPMENNVDAAYFSYTNTAYYLFKDSYFWKLAGPRDRLLNPHLYIPENAVGPRQKISSYWKDICDVGETELMMALPSS